MFQPQPWIILAVAIVGNCGFWLFCFNRAGASGLSRWYTKRIELVCIFLCGLIPTVIGLQEFSAIQAWVRSPTPRWWPYSAPLFEYYGAWCTASFFVLGPLWLESRRWLVPPRHLIDTKSEYFSVDRHVEGGSAADRFTVFLDRLPGNEITDLCVTSKELRLPRPLREFDGLKIGHVSDVHFTGQFRQEHYQFVFDQLLHHAPDLVIVSGDIIDHDACLPWIEPVLGRLHAPLGCCFVLGNHDLRISQVSELTDRLDSLGFVDLGRANHSIAVGDSCSIDLFGNELPWHARHFGGMQIPPIDTLDESRLRLGVAHSPDQIGWARRNRLDLLLAGHTHGGQVRFPGIGPIVAPSGYGSRFASGVFYLKPTLMHVSRGIAGTHPVRWRCHPEVSVLTLRA